MCQSSCGAAPGSRDNKVHDLLSRLVIETEKKKNKFKSSLLYAKIPNLDVDVRDSF